MWQPTAPTISLPRCSQAASHAPTTAGGVGVGAEADDGGRTTEDGSSRTTDDRRQRTDRSCRAALSSVVCRLSSVYLTTTTGVPTPTRANKSVTSSLSMRMQPCETKWPIEDGWLVPWMA